MPRSGCSVLHGGSPKEKKKKKNWEKKNFFTGAFKEFFYTEQFSKMQIFLQGIFQEFVNRFGTTYLKNGFL